MADRLVAKSGTGVDPLLVRSLKPKCVVVQPERGIAEPLHLTILPDRHGSALLVTSIVYLGHGPSRCVDLTQWPPYIDGGRSKAAE